LNFQLHVMHPIVKNDSFIFLNHRYCKLSSLLVKRDAWILQREKTKNHF